MVVGSGFCVGVGFKLDQEDMRGWCVFGDMVVGWVGVFVQLVLSSIECLGVLSGPLRSCILHIAA